MERVALLADVHGNRWALEAALADADRRRVDAVIDLGDSVFGPLDPAGTADLLIRRGIASVAGNEDRIVVAPAHEGEPPTLRFTRAALRPEHLRWLAGLPQTRIVAGAVLCCHGTPTRDDEYLLEAVTEHGAEQRDLAGVAALLRGVEQPAIACGHSHLQRVVRLRDGTLVANPGSVGLPAYADDAPHPHVIGAGSPHARYALLERSSRGWRVEPVAVPYDWEAAAMVAERNGRADWARWIRSGVAS